MPRLLHEPSRGDWKRRAHGRRRYGQKEQTGDQSQRTEGGATGAIRVRGSKQRIERQQAEGNEEGQQCDQQLEARVTTECTCRLECCGPTAADR